MLHVVCCVFHEDILSFLKEKKKQTVGGLLGLCHGDCSLHLEFACDELVCRDHFAGDGGESWPAVV